MVLTLLGLTLAACSNSHSNTKASARDVATAHLECASDKLSYLVYTGGASKFGLQRALFYAFEGCAKKTCVKCTDGDCRVKEFPTDDLCPPGIVRAEPHGKG